MKTPTIATNNVTVYATLLQARVNRQKTLEKQALLTKGQNIINSMISPVNYRSLARNYNMTKALYNALLKGRLVWNEYTKDFIRIIKNRNINLTLQGAFDLYYYYIIDGIEKPNITLPDGTITNITGKYTSPVISHSDQKPTETKQAYRLNTFDSFIRLEIPENVAYNMVQDGVIYNRVSYNNNNDIAVLDVVAQYNIHTAIARGFCKYLEKQGNDIARQLLQGIHKPYDMDDIASDIFQTILEYRLYGGKVWLELTTYGNKHYLQISGTTPIGNITPIQYIYRTIDSKMYSQGRKRAIYENAIIDTPDENGIFSDTLEKVEKMTDGKAFIDTDTLPLHYKDFINTLSDKDKSLIVALYSGYTWRECRKITGYKTDSHIAYRLNKIKQSYKDYFKTPVKHDKASTYLMNCLYHGIEYGYTLYNTDKVAFVSSTVNDIENEMLIRAIFNENVKVSARHNLNAWLDMVSAIIA